MLFSWWEFRLVVDLLGGEITRLKTSNLVLKLVL